MNFGHLGHGNRLLRVAGAAGPPPPAGSINFTLTRHQDRNGHVAQQMTRNTTHNQFTQA